MPPFISLFVIWFKVFLIPRHGAPIIFLVRILKLLPIVTYWKGFPYIDTTLNSASISGLSVLIVFSVECLLTRLFSNLMKGISNSRAQLLWLVVLFNFFVHCSVNANFACWLWFQLDGWLTMLTSVINIIKLWYISTIIVDISDVFSDQNSPYLVVDLQFSFFAEGIRFSDYLLLTTWKLVRPNDIEEV